MKIYIFVICAICFSGLTKTYAQTVNDIPIGQLEAQYIRILTGNKPWSFDLQITIDLGLENNISGMLKNSLKDEKGKPIEFSTDITALNFFFKYGYKLTSTYSFTREGSTTSIVYILEKK
jgi:hypothetical protein